MRIIYIAFALLVALASKSQQSYFTLTPTGFVSSADSSQTFQVIQMPNQSKEQLYKKVLKYVNKFYTSPKDVISKVDGESITINGFSSDKIRRNSMHVFDINYTINIEFKESKIRINSPGFSLETYTHKPQKLWLVRNADLDGSNQGIYNTSLKLKSKLAKEDLERFFTVVLSHLITEVTKSEESW